VLTVTVQHEAQRRANLCGLKLRGAYHDQKHGDASAFIGRIFFSLMFLVFGYWKPIGFAGSVTYMGSRGLHWATRLISRSLYRVNAVLLVLIAVGLAAGHDTA
jgi:uncharacterized membrane protein YphA (DoxX/SURF4 family)